MYPMLGIVTVEMQIFLVDFWLISVSFLIPVITINNKRNNIFELEKHLERTELHLIFNGITEMKSTFLFFLTRAHYIQ